MNTLLAILLIAVMKNHPNQSICSKSNTWRHLVQWLACLPLLPATAIGSQRWKRSPFASRFQIFQVPCRPQHSILAGWSMHEKDNLSLCLCKCSPVLILYYAKESIMDISLYSQQRTQTGKHALIGWRYYEVCFPACSTYRFCLAYLWVRFSGSDDYDVDTEVGLHFVHTVLF